MKIKKEMLIIYNSKDEEFFEHIESLIMNDDDTSAGLVGVKDDSVIVYKCLVGNYKKLENTVDKYLFVDCIPKNANTKQLFNKYGVSYGTIDKDHFYIKVDDSYKWDRLSYDSFSCELHCLLDNPITQVDAFKNTEEVNSRSPVNRGLRIVSIAVAPVVGVALQANDTKNEIQWRIIRRKQLLYYGLTKMYLDDLESLINS